MKLKSVSEESMNEITKAFSEYKYEDTEKAYIICARAKKGSKAI